MKSGPIPLNPPYYSEPDHSRLWFQRFFFSTEKTMVRTKLTTKFTKWNSPPVYCLRTITSSQQRAFLIKKDKLTHCYHVYPLTDATRRKRILQCAQYTSNRTPAKCRRGPTLAATQKCVVHALLNSYMYHPLYREILDESKQIERTAVF